MRLRYLVAFVLFAALMASVAPGRAGAASTPTCHGKKATASLKTPGTLAFTSGNDVLVGSNGADTFQGGTAGGTDLVCGNGGDDAIDIDGVGSAAYGGLGNDTINVTNGATGYGETGDDALTATGAGSTADGGAGNDWVTANDGAIARGGSGNDQVDGFTANSLYGDSGEDTVYSEGTASLVDCGSNFDEYASFGAAPTIKRCEDRFCGCFVMPNLDILYARIAELKQVVLGWRLAL
jgi:Ca2+-binding RTX toxin-like protein